MFVAAHPSILSLLVLVVAYHTARDRIILRSGSRISGTATNQFDLHTAIVVSSLPVQKRRSTIYTPNVAPIGPVPLFRRRSKSVVAGYAYRTLNTNQELTIVQLVGSHLHPTTHLIRPESECHICRHDHRVSVCNNTPTLPTIRWAGRPPVDPSIE